MNPFPTNDNVSVSRPLPAWLRPWPVAGLIVLLWLGLFLVRLAAPPDFVDSDHQEREAAYVLDVLANGHWVFQQNQTGELSGKLPLFTWLSAGFSCLFSGGRLTVLSLYLPSALSVLGVMLLLWHSGRRRLGVWAGLFAALFFLVSPAGSKMIFLARKDVLFTFTVTLAMLAAYRAWERGGSAWLGFWLAGVLASFAKWPIGVVLGALGLIAFYFDRLPAAAPKSDAAEIGTGARSGWWFAAGLILFLILFGGWCWLAWQQWGETLHDRLISNELADTVQSQPGRSRGLLSECYKPGLYLVSRFLPWSLLGLWGAWRAWFRPDVDPGRRRFTRFLAVAVVLGALGFSLSPHTRPDLLFPLMPPLALLAGLEAARLLRPELRVRLTVAGLAIAVAALLGGSFWYHHLSEPRKDRNVIRTRGVAEIQRQLVARYGAKPPELIYTDCALALQIFRNTLQQNVKLADAAARLAGDNPVLVVTKDAGELRRLLPPGAAVEEIIPWPEAKSKEKNFLCVLTNRPAAAAVKAP